MYPGHKYYESCGTDTWFGWREWEAVGAVSATLQGSGTATLRFGECCDNGPGVPCGPSSDPSNVDPRVEVYLNQEKIAEARHWGGRNSRSVDFEYSRGDQLVIAEYHTAVIKLYELTFRCGEGN